MSKPTRNLSVVYAGPNKVEVKDTGYPAMVDPRGNAINHAVIVKLVATNICGSDLHMYRGRTSVSPGFAFGHEQTGQVVEAGVGVHRVKVGDIVSIPFNVACGCCVNCKERKTNLCLEVNPLKIGGAYGYADMGGWRGGQAEYNLVPYADFNCLVMPNDSNLMRNMLDCAMLSDILPTGFDTAVRAGVGVGKTVLVAGAGPVGICCAASCVLLGAAVVVVADPNAARLENAKKLGPVIRTLDVSRLKSEADIGQALQPLIGHQVVDCGCECVGFECCGFGRTANTDNKQEAMLIEAVKSGGDIGVDGVYLPQDPKGSNELYKAGMIPLSFGKVFVKGLGMKAGQCPVLSYNRELLISILRDRLRVSHALSVEVIGLEEAPEAYKRFSAGEPVKFVIDPHNILRQAGAHRPQQPQQEHKANV